MAYEHILVDSHEAGAGVTVVDALAIKQSPRPADRASLVRGCGRRLLAMTIVQRLLTKDRG